jgi:hypothetical protein
LKEPPKTTDAITLEQMKAAAAPDPNVAQNAPASPKVETNPKKTPWKVVGKGRQAGSLDFGRWGF